MWKSPGGYYVMDMSSFPDEKEVLLFDGITFKVMSFEKTQDQKGDLLNFIKLQGYEYFKD